MLNYVQSSHCLSVLTVYQCCGSGSGDEQPDRISESLETIFWVKILYLNSLTRNRDGKNSDPGSGMEKNWIGDKHPGSAKLLFMEISRYKTCPPCVTCSSSSLSSSSVSSSSSSCSSSSSSYRSSSSSSSYSYS